MVEGICELTLEARDVALLERFYTEVFALPVLAREDDRVWLGVGRACRLGLWTPGPKEFGDEGGRHVHFAFAAPPGGLEGLRRRLEAHGVEAHGPERHEGGDRSLYVRDPEGNVVEVWDFFARGQGAREGVAALADD